MWQLFDIFDEIKKEAAQKNATSSPPYLLDYFNTIGFYKRITGGVKYAVARIVNSLIEALNTKDRLPRFIIVIPGKNVVSDINVFEFGASRVLADITRWMVRQISILVHRKKMELTTRKPGAVFFNDPRIVFVRMIRRQDSYPIGSKMDKICGLRAKFNDALNEAITNTDQHILTINSCHTVDHFDKWGNLSVRGMYAFWDEIDNLLERFDKDKIKLLPAPRQKPWSNDSNRHAHTDQQHCESHDTRRYVLPLPPPETFHRSHHH